MPGELGPWTLDLLWTLHDIVSSSGVYPQSDLDVALEQGTRRSSSHCRALHWFCVRPESQEVADRLTSSSTAACSEPCLDCELRRLHWTSCMLPAGPCSAMQVPGLASDTKTRSLTWLLEFTAGAGPG